MNPLGRQDKHKKLKYNHHNISLFWKYLTAFKVNSHIFFGQEDNQKCLTDALGKVKGYLVWDDVSQR